MDADDNNADGLDVVVVVVVSSDDCFSFRAATFVEDSNVSLIVVFDFTVNRHSHHHHNLQ